MSFVDAQNVVQTSRHWAIITSLKMPLPKIRLPFGSKFIIGECLNTLLRSNRILQQVLKCPVRAALKLLMVYTFQIDVKFAENVAKNVAMNDTFVVSLTSANISLKHRNTQSFESYRIILKTSLQTSFKCTTLQTLLTIC